MTRYLELTSRTMPTPLHHQGWLKRPWRDGSIWQCPLPFSISVTREATIPWSPWDLILSGNTHNFNWEERSSTVLHAHTWMAPVVDGHAMTWQSWPHQSSSDGPGRGYPVLWETFPSRRSELRWGRKTPHWHLQVLVLGFISWHALPPTL